MRIGGVLCLVLAASWLAGAQRSGAQTKLAVASFERISGAGQGVPDVAGRLAERFATQGIEKVVGPAELGAPPLAEPPAHEAAEWARKAGVDYLVVGRTTRLGNHLSVDVRLLQATGLPVGPRLVEEAGRPEDLGRAIEALANQLLARLETSPAAVAARAPAAKNGADKGSGEGRFSSDSPISIKSNELEATEQGGRRKFVFTGNVRAIQDDLNVRSDRLEAFYPEGASQPDRLVATGHVVLVQTGRTANCEKAVYYRGEEKLVCTGQAELVQECDRVRGEVITFFLGSEVLKVTGAADVKLRPEDEECASSTASRTGP